jgi:hypothetical protein
MPEKFEQVLNAKLYAEIQDLPLGVVEPKPKQKFKGKRK